MNFEETRYSKTSAQTQIVGIIENVLPSIPISKQYFVAFRRLDLAWQHLAWIETKSDQAQLESMKNQARCRGLGET